MLWSAVELVTWREQRSSLEVGRIHQDDDAPKRAQKLDSLFARQRLKAVQEGLLQQRWRVLDSIQTRRRESDRDFAAVVMAAFAGHKLSGGESVDDPRHRRRRQVYDLAHLHHGDVFVLELEVVNGAHTHQLGDGQAKLALHLLRVDRDPSDQLTDAAKDRLCNIVGGKHLSQYSRSATATVGRTQSMGR